MIREYCEVLNATAAEEGREQMQNGLFGFKRSQTMNTQLKCHFFSGSMPMTLQQQQQFLAANHLSGSQHLKFQQQMNASAKLNTAVLQQQQQQHQQQAQAQFRHAAQATTLISPQPS